MRHKYEPHQGPNRGQNRIKEDWIKETFGEQYRLVWNGHSHFVEDTNTGEWYYIFKTLRCLYPVNEYWQYKALGRKYLIKE